MDEISDEELAFLTSDSTRSVPPRMKDEDIRLAESIFRENLPLAAQAICTIAAESTNERTKLAAAKYVVERVLGRVDVARPMESDSPYDILKGILREPTAEERAYGRGVSRG